MTASEKSRAAIRVLDGVELPDDAGESGEDATADGVVAHGVGALRRADGVRAVGAAGLPRRLADRDEAVLAAEVVEAVVHVALDQELVQDGHQRRVIQQLLSRAAPAVAAGVDVGLDGVALGLGKDPGQQNPALGVHLEELLVGDGAHGDRLVGGMVARGLLSRRLRPFLRVVLPAHRGRGQGRGLGALGRRGWGEGD